jgi:hypothetical protein
MKRLIPAVAMGCLAVLLSLSVGCNRRPDPRENPDFNESSLKDPMSIEMAPTGRPGRKGSR